METKSRRSLRFQYAMGRAAVFIAAPLVFLAMKIAGYRIRDLRQVRQRVQKLMEGHRGPWLICANHLTLIDSVILAYAMFPGYRYMFRYQLMPWNLPEKMNFNRSKAVRTACYLSKCIPVVRGGDRGEVKATLEKCAFLLSKGESLMIFPEGTRSRSGRVNTRDYPYGVGRMITTTPGCRVMCIYLRGDGQTTYSNFPKYREKFDVQVAECRPKTAFRGLKAHRECTRQVILQLAEMEKNYFESHRQ